MVTKINVGNLLPRLLLDNKICNAAPSYLRMYLDDEIVQWLTSNDITIFKIDMSDWSPDSLGRQLDPTKIYVEYSFDNYPDDDYYLEFENPRDAMLFRLRWC